MPILEKFSQNFRQPSVSHFGEFIKHFLAIANRGCEIKAVQLLQVQPHHNVLEIGFGPGVGIKRVFDKGFGNGIGKMYGVDFSTSMCQNAEKRFKQHIDTGKLTILKEDVAKMSLPDAHIDRAFHLHSHYYWPDMTATCSELFRVMKPDAVMVNVMNYAIIKYAVYPLGFMKCAVSGMDLDEYAEALKKSGFVDIDVQKLKSTPGYMAVTCRKD